MIHFTQTMSLDGTFVSYLANSRSKPLCRNAVDFGLPLIVDSNLAELWVNTVAAKIPTGIFKPRREGVVPSDVKSWREFVPHA